MAFMQLFIFLFSIPLVSAGELMPSLFRASDSEKAQYCADPMLQNSSHWKNLMGNQIDSLIKDSRLSGIEMDVYKNQLVTLSYLEIHRTKNFHARMMGYVYGNASHHLGRLVRYHFWKKFGNEEIAKRDQELISGNVLGTTLRLFPLTLSKNLMSHSLELYKTLSWSLAAASICGNEYVKEMLHGEDKDLIQAFNAPDTFHFAHDFIAFEQKFLHKTMYKEPLIKVPASLGILDKMRFIPFNGEKTLSFFEWCEETNCEKTSLDLEKRIEFDRLIVNQEMKEHADDIRARLKNSGIMNVSQFLFKGFCKEGKVPHSLCR